ncbi:cytochrome P450 6a2-like isoform X2 [Galleria mellonella]|uniref:unspecific monooxygenase n=1 Tax=Galleria mellonella TaxID=7137 RepID=A0ABM3MZ71_GALME|nr:cytochrome P450 6a2-like isoform X2 [Galleria mellonella]
MAVFLILFATSIFLIYVWFQYKFTYWSKKGVDGPKPVFLYGNIRDALRRKDHFFQPYCDSYIKFKHLPYVGMYSFYRPVLCVNDLDLAKRILIVDFEHFQSRGIYSGGPNDPLAENLFNISGKAWKQLRVKMSPTFTSGKLRTMYPFVESVASKALSYADLYYSKGKPIDFSEFYDRYAMEIIANVGFGVECNILTNPQSEFDCCAREYFEIKSLYWSIIRAFAFIAPDLFSKLRIRRISPKVENFFYGLVKETVSYRQKNNYKRNDFLQTLIDLMNGQIVNENGYETSAKTGQFAAYQLALNPHIQTKVRDEIDRVLAKYDGQCTYEAQNEMVYLNMVLDETMRLYPALRAIFRRCNKPYKLPNSDVVIEEGTLVFVPIQEIHMDPELYPEPKKFDPERFAPEKKAKLHPCQWMPFGEGPRKCLGVRQGYIQSKLALIKILQKYELLIDERTSVPLKLKTSCLVWAAEGGVWLKLRELNNNNDK